MLSGPLASGTRTYYLITCILFNHLFACAFSVLYTSDSLITAVALLFICYAIVLSYSCRYLCRSSWSPLTW